MGKDVKDIPYCVALWLRVPPMSLGSTGVLSLRCTSFRTERFFFISLGSWDTWRLFWLCFEIDILTTNGSSALCGETLSDHSPAPATMCSDLHFHTPSRGFSAAGWPQGEMTAWTWEKAEGETVSGFSWLPRRARQLEGGERSVPGEWLFWESCSLVTLIPCLCLLHLLILQPAPVYPWRVGQYLRSPSRYEGSQSSYLHGHKHW